MGKLIDKKCLIASASVSALAKSSSRPLLNCSRRGKSRPHKSFRGNEVRLMDVALVEIAGIVLVLVYVMRTPNQVRAISPRRASKQERKLYASWQEIQ